MLSRKYFNVWIESKWVFMYAFQHINWRRERTANYSIENSFACCSESVSIAWISNILSSYQQQIFLVPVKSLSIVTENGVKNPYTHRDNAVCVKLAPTLPFHTHTHKHTLCTLFVKTFSKQISKMWTKSTENLFPKTLWLLSMFTYL